MEEKKITLIEALKAVANALRNGSVNYDWTKIDHCNCGLVAQAITRTGTSQLYQNYLAEIDLAFREKKESNSFTPTWSEMVAEHCPLTGRPVAEIFQKLYDAGMTREDISELEYLSNPEILSKANINTNPTTETYTAKEKRKTGWWIFENEITVSVPKTKEVYYYQKKENLLVYIEAWIEILKKTRPEAKIILIDGDEYKYRNHLQLEQLKTHFLKRENYNAVTKVQEELDKLTN